MPIRCCAKVGAFDRVSRADTSILPFENQI